MSDSAELEARFSALGGTFLTPAGALAARLEQVRGVVFDWDGVFNSGVKDALSASSFSEADSMGTNLLRYALWRRSGELPVTAIITGEYNPRALEFARREHFHAVYQGIRNKADAMNALRATCGLQAHELACVFDDVNDLPMVAGCAVRVLVRRLASPLLEDHVARDGLCDYVTAMEGGHNAVREAAELLIGLLGAFDEVVTSRVASDQRYAQYFAARQAVETWFDPARR